MLTPAAARPSSARSAEAARRAAWAWTAAATLLLLAPLPAPVADATAALGELPWDKLGHAALFFFLTRSWMRSLAGEGATAGRRALLVALAAVAYGGAAELAQSPLAGRSAEWGDLAADALGAALAWSRR